MLLRDRALVTTGRSLCPECLSRAPSSARRRSPARSLLPRRSTRRRFFLLRQLLPSKEDTVRPDKRQLLRLKGTGTPTPPEGAPQGTTRPLPARGPPTSAKPSYCSFSHQSDAQQSSSRCRSWARRRAPWANGAGHAKQRPERLHPCLQGARAAAWTAKRPGLRAGPWLTGQPWSQGPTEAPSLRFRGTLTRTPLTGRSPHTGCQLSTKAPRPGP